MRKARGLALALFVSTFPLHARIGETRTQLMAHYGSGKDVGDQMLFTVQDYSLTIFFNQKGQSSMEFYAKRQDNLGQRAALTEEEIKKLLADNSAGKTWELLPNQVGPNFWRRSDNAVFAQYKADDKVMTFVAGTP